MRWGLWGWARGIWDGGGGGGEGFGGVRWEGWAWTWNCPATWPLWSPPVEHSTQGWSEGRMTSAWLNYYTLLHFYCDMSDMWWSFQWSCPICSYLRFYLRILTIRKCHISTCTTSAPFTEKISFAVWELVSTNASVKGALFVCLLLLIFPLFLCYFLWLQNSL